MIEFHILLQLVLGAIVAGVAVTVAFALTIVGATRFSESRRAERRIATGAYAALTALALTAFFACVAFGVLVITTK